MTSMSILRGMGRAQRKTIQYMDWLKGGPQVG